MRYLQESVAAIGGVIGWLVGGWSILLTVLFILNTFDFLTGMAANWGNISSKRGYEGIVKKGMMWVWIVVANLIYLVLDFQGLDIGIAIPNAVAILFIINEVASLGENSIKLGISIPEPIQKGLALFNSKKEGDK
ncbi:phage holin family protein [Metabacillus litoralis]|uniref:phage holin family protein n=1 Tax=Metabacillus litoralis TaxID=152268 RepID=UPI00204268ED|nr:phage holin family protein [Metabacillus litoralis]MCM3413505.1 phage holin family protein [Metabacillus litoralis]